MKYQNAPEERDNALKRVAEKFGSEPRPLEDSVRAAADNLGLSDEDKHEMKDIRGRVYAQNIKHARGEMDFLARYNKDCRGGSKFYRKLGAGRL